MLSSPSFRLTAIIAVALTPYTTAVPVRTGNIIHLRSNSAASFFPSQDKVITGAGTPTNGDPSTLVHFIGGPNGLDCDGGVACVNFCNIVVPKNGGNAASPWVDCRGALDGTNAMKYWNEHANDYIKIPVPATTKTSLPDGCTCAMPKNGVCAEIDC